MSLCRRHFLKKGNLKRPHNIIDVLLTLTLVSYGFSFLFPAIVSRHGGKRERLWRSQIKGLSQSAATL